MMQYAREGQWGSGLYFARDPGCEEKVSLAAVARRVSPCLPACEHV
jgi:hypothetical protein